jgi:cation diffusion facilitator CzcD-associated flavoprotein CzcO
MTDFDVVIVGAGISGIGTGIELLRRGMTSFILLEAAGDLGGTWRDNTYPGIAVDIPAVSYCFSYETDYPWSRVFATGDEVQRYVRYCVRKYGLDAHIRYRARVVRSEVNNATGIWTTTLENGAVISSRYLISATGQFGQPKVPSIPGLDTFAGKTMHTGRWDHEHELREQRVALIGTGATAVQLVPEIAPVVSKLVVFQRTPIWLSPKWSLRRLRLVRSTFRWVSEASLEFLTFAIVNFRRLPFLVRLIQRGFRWSMLRQVTNPATAAKLNPGYGLGCKRPSMSNRYLPAFNRPNVTLVTEPIERICPSGVVTADGVVHDVDTLILATGYTTTEPGTEPRFAVIGCDGLDLGQFWREHRRQAYAGVSVPGFPNFFLTAGPYSGGFNWFAMLEANLAHIMRCIEDARARGVTWVEVRREAHGRYMQHLWKRAAGTVFLDQSCATSRSYYIDSHGDASLPQPHTPLWRVVRGRVVGTHAYQFGRPQGTA